QTRRHPENHMIGSIDTRIAKRALCDRRAKTVEEGIAASKAVEKALVAHVAARHNGLRAGSGNSHAEPATDFGERSVPGDSLKFPPPLRAPPAERMEDPIAAVNPILVVLDLDAKTAAGERMIRIAADAYYSPVLYRRQHCTGVGTIVRAGAQK